MKYHQATPNRPDGGRHLDAALIPIDLLKYTSQLLEEEAYAKNGKNAITLFKSDAVTITLIALKAEKDFHPVRHQTEMIMSLQILEGEITFQNLDNIEILSQGELITMHQSLAFKAKAKIASICLLTLLKG